MIELPQNFYFSATFNVFTDGTERWDRTTENGTESWDRTSPDPFGLCSYSFLPVVLSLADDSPFGRGGISYLVNDIG